MALFSKKACRLKASWPRLGGTLTKKVGMYLGLQGCVFTRDINQALAISDAMETGTVQVGGSAWHSHLHCPVAGWGKSGCE